MRILFTLFVCLALTSCISIPIPPSGDKMGDYGRVEIGIKIRYIPNDKLDWFNPIIPQPKLYKDK
jgi:hypothetical protein